MFLSVLLIFGIALVLNVSTSAAASTHMENNVIVDYSTPKVTTLNPTNKVILKKLTPTKVIFNKNIKTENNNIYLNNCKKTIYTKNRNIGKTSTITTTSKLAPITVAQMEDGIVRAESFYGKNERLPKTLRYGSTLIPIAKFIKIIATQGLTIKKPKIAASNASLASIMVGASKYGYSGRAHTANDMVSTGSGDCWAMSDYLYKKMNAVGIEARIIQYATSYSSRHRSVQYLSNGSWVNAPYRTYFKTNRFNNTSNYGTVITFKILS